MAEQHEEEIFSELGSGSDAHHEVFDFSGHAEWSSSSPLLHSAMLILLTIGVMVLLSWFWPQESRELLWTVETAESEQRRIRALILPHEALEWPKQASATPHSKSAQLVSKVKRVGQAAGLTRSSQQGGWVFKPERARTDCTPLLVFVNRGSGGRQGAATLLKLRRLLSPYQVIDLDQGIAEEVLQSFGTVGRFRVLACGGDGTVGWVLSLLDSAGLEYTPPLAILPLGTGNDLARALGWGGRHAARDWVTVLEEVERAQVALLDRWQVSIDDARLPRQLGASLHRSKPQRAPRNLIMQNYLGIGVDAKVALAWHQRRQRQPQRYRSHWRNKLRYARDGVKQMLCGGDFPRLMAGLVVEADGVQLQLPPNTQGLIVLNIPSYGGGSDLWGVGMLDEEEEEVEAPAAAAAALPGKRAGGKPSSNGQTPPRSPTPVGDEMAEAAAAEAVAGDGAQRLQRNLSGGSSSEWRRAPAEAFVPPSMDDGLLEVVTVQNVLQLGLAQMSLSGARRLCQCSRLTLRSTETLPVQVDGEPFELEPMFAPRKPMTISVRHHNQAVMLSRSRVRADGVALEALDWALQEGVISVEQRNCVLREVARRTGKLQRAGSTFGSSVSLGSLEAFSL